MEAESEVSECGLLEVHSKFTIMDDNSSALIWTYKVNSFISLGAAA